MNIKNIPFGEIDGFYVVVETPQGSCNEYEYDENTQAFKLNFVYKNGLSYPFNYGSVAGTRGGDGDFLDAIVFSSFPLPVGSIVLCQAVGMIELLDRGERDNKIITVPILDPLSEKYNSLEDFSEEQIRQMEDFFQEVAVQKNKIMEIKGFFGKGRALEEIEKSKQ